MANDCKLLLQITAVDTSRKMTGILKDCIKIMESYGRDTNVWDADIVTRVKAVSSITWDTRAANHRDLDVHIAIIVLHFATVFSDTSDLNIQNSRSKLSSSESKNSRCFTNKNIILSVFFLFLTVLVYHELRKELNIVCISICEWFLSFCFFFLFF